MSKLGILNLLMFIILLVLSASIYFAPEPPPADEARLTTLAPAQVERIHLQRNLQDDVQLEKRDDHWFMQYAGQSLPANQWRVDNLLKLLHAKPEHQFQSSDDAQYGLLPPKASVQFNHLTLKIGDNDPIKRLRYIAQDSTVSLVTDQYYLHLFADATDYLSLAPLGGLKITAVTIDGKQPALQGDDRQAWLDNWQYLQALQVTAASNLSGEQTINVQLKDGTQLTLLRQGQYLIRPDLKLAYELNDGLVQQLFTLR